MENYDETSTVSKKSFLDILKGKEDNNKFNLFPVSTHVLFFLVGWVGLSIVATIISIFIISYYNSIGVDITEGLPILGSVLSNFLSYAAIAIILILIIVISSRDNIKSFFIHHFKNKNALIDGVGYGFLLLLASSAVSVIISMLRSETGSVNANESAIRVMTANYPILLAFMTTILAPICEEITYRLGLFNIFRRKNRIVAYVVSSLIFAFIHFTIPDQDEFFKQNLINEIWNIFSYITSGIILCRAYEKHQSIATSMIAHAINNGVAVLSIIISNLAL